MNLEKTLDALEKLASAMERQDLVERLQTYAAASLLLAQVREHAIQRGEKGDNVGWAKNYTTEMMAALDGLAGIGEYEDDQREQCASWVRTGVRKLRSMHGFNLAP